MGSPSQRSSSPIAGLTGLSAMGTAVADSGPRICIAWVMVASSVPLHFVIQLGLSGEILRQIDRVDRSWEVGKDPSIAFLSRNSLDSLLNPTCM